MTIIVGFTGEEGAGKDTAGQALERFGFQRIAFADAVRNTALEANPIIYDSRDPYRLTDAVAEHGWETAKRAIPEVRRYLKHHGQGMRTLNPDTWINVVKEHVADAILDGKHIAITDVRFPTEVNFIRSLGGIIARITRTNNPHTLPAALATGDTANLDADLELHNYEDDPGNLAFQVMWLAYESGADLDAHTLHKGRGLR